MSRRYEPIPQRDEVIILDSIQNSASYNYNSGIGNSVPSSRAPSIAPSYAGNFVPQHNHAPSIHSIPNSPPPSFHTVSSPGTPRPIPSQASGDYAELWGVAPSTRGAQTEMCAGSEALQTVAELKAQVDRLEESIGRLLLLKDAEDKEPETYNGGNCCLTFTDASPSLERGLSAAGGNCCITFHHSNNHRERQRRDKLVWLGIAMLTCMVFIITMYALRKGVTVNKDTVDAF